MGIKPAQQAFGKDDIIDILKRNVTLYKNEPEFVEYIVNLALYLIDQAYCLGGMRSGDLEAVLERFERMRSQPVPEGYVLAPFHDVPAASAEADLDLGGDEELQDRPTNKLRLAQFEGVFKAPPPPTTPGTERFRIPGAAPDAPVPAPARTNPVPPVAHATPIEGPLENNDEEIDPTTGQVRAQELMDALEPKRRLVIDQRVPLGFKQPQKAEKPSAAPPPAKPPRGPKDMDDFIDEEVSAEPRTRQLRSPAQMTPIPPGGLTDRAPQIEVGNTGRTRVYKMVRSYSASQGKDSNCPICGSDTKGANICPTCGHIL